MTASHTKDAHAAAMPYTEDAPFLDAICHKKWNDIVLSQTAYWVDDECNHIIQSTDFDLLAIADTPAEALKRFVEDVYDLMDSLDELIQQGEATDTEKALYAQLTQPIIAVLRREDEERQRRLVSIQFRRLRRRGHDRDWGSGSHPTKSARLSTA